MCEKHGTNEETKEIPTGFWGGNVVERNHLEDLGLVVRIILKWAFQKYGGMSLTRLILLTLGKSGVL